MHKKFGKLKRKLMEVIRPTSKEFVNDLLPTESNDKVDESDKISPKTDGINHINTSLIAETKFGRLLDIYHKSPFTLGDLGTFATVAGFSYYITDPDSVDKSKYRTLSGSSLKNYSKHAKLVKINNYKKSIAHATYLKVIANNELLEGMIKSTLPFRHYYVTDAGVSNYTRYDNWYVQILNEIRRVIKLNNELDDDSEIISPNWDFIEDQDVKDDSVDKE